MPHISLYEAVFYKGYQKSSFPIHSIFYCHNIRQRYKIQFSFTREIKQVQSGYKKLTNLYENKKNIEMF